MRRAWVLLMLCAALGVACDSESNVRIHHPQLGDLEPTVANALGAGREQWELDISATADPVLVAAAHARLGMLYLANHFTRAAAGMFALAAKSERTEYRWPYYRALALLEAGELELAQRALAQCLNLKPDFWPAHYRSARAYLAAGDAAAAGPRVESALRLQPTDAAVLALAGEAALANGNLDEARAYFEGALAVQPSATRLYYPLARALRDVDPVAAGAMRARAGDGEVYPNDELERELMPFAQSGQIFLERGKIFLAQRNYPAAQTAFAEAVSRNPDDGYALASLGRVIEISGDTQRANELYARALAMEPDAVTVHYFAGALDERRGDDAGAIEHYKKAVELDPLFAQTRLLLAHAYLRFKDDENALPHYRALADQLPSNMQSRYYLALIHLVRGRCEPARAVVREALAIQANYGPVLEVQARMLAVCPATPEEKSLALDIARAIAAARPDARSAVTMAIAAAAAGDDTLAAQSAARARELRPGKRSLAALDKFLGESNRPQFAWSLDSADLKPPRLTASSLK